MPRMGFSHRTRLRRQEWFDDRPQFIWYKCFRHERIVPIHRVLLDTLNVIPLLHFGVLANTNILKRTCNDLFSLASL